MWKGVGVVNFNIGDEVKVKGVRSSKPEVIEEVDYEYDISGTTSVYYLIDDEYYEENMLEPIEDPLATKIEERNNKPVKMISDENLLNENDPIKPAHYRKGEIDLYESWYRTYPFNEFRAGMQMIAERYMKRDKHNRVEDINKSIETLTRLKEYEELEKSKKALSEFN